MSSYFLDGSEFPQIRPEIHPERRTREEPGKARHAPRIGKERGGLACRPQRHPDPRNERRQDEGRRAWPGTPGTSDRITGGTRSESASGGVVSIPKAGKAIAGNPAGIDQGKAAGHPKISRSVTPRFTIQPPRGPAKPRFPSHYSGAPGFSRSTPPKAKSEPDR